MKILVTGTTGQVGWHLERLLPAIGETIAPGRETLDFERPDSIRNTIRAVRPDIIVNAAGHTEVDRVEAEPAPAYAVNAVAPGILAEEARRTGALLIHYSSVFVFDGTADKPYTEADTPHPINEYGRSKLAGEHAIAAVGGAYLILRASWVYDARRRNFLLAMLRLAAIRDELTVVDDQIGSPAWARSLAQATVAMLRDPAHAKAATGLYNLASVGAVSRYDFAARLLQLTAHLRQGRSIPRLIPIKTAEFPLGAPRPLNAVLDTSKLLGTFPQSLDGWEQQLQRCVSELRPSASQATRDL